MTARLTRAQMRHMVNRGVRKHGCENCHVVFTCTPCTEAMYRAQRAVYRRQYSFALYCQMHEPVGNGHELKKHQLRRAWLCDDCRASAAERIAV